MRSQNSISFDEIKKNLKTSILGKELYVFDSVKSTFDAVQSLCVKHGAVVCAKEQTGGVGRLGRSWESQNGGIYASVVLNPEIYSSDMSLFTIACALGVQRAISKHVKCSIKWPNDIVPAEGKKLCGILTKIKFQNGKCEYVNVGIGINANNKKFSSELKHAGSVGESAGKEINENAMLCDVLYEIEKIIFLKNSNLIEEFSDACITVGSKVKAIYAGGEEIFGIGRNIAANGSLIIEKEDGTLVEVGSGEVSVRGIYGEEYV